ncbi:hypothetical protein UT300012_21460 [Paraclostridium bifermentans]
MKKSHVTAVVVTGSLALGTVVGSQELKAYERDKDPMMVSPYGSVSSVPRAYGLRAGAVTPTVREGNQKVLVVMVEFGGQQFTTEPQKYHDMFFSSGVDSVNSWLKDQSKGKLQISAAPTTQEGMPVGVVKVRVDPSIVDGKVGTKSYEEQKILAEEAIKQAKDLVNWGEIDKDGNSTFVDSFHGDYVNPVNEELTIATVFPGNTDSDGTGANGPESWPHLSQINTSLSAGGKNYNFRNVSIITSEKVDGIPVQTSILGHEYLHSLGARDMYKDRDSIGAWSIMDKAYGNREGEETGNHLTPVDPVHKLSWGWIKSATMPKDTKEGSYNDLSSTNNVIEVPDPSNSKISYLLEFRNYGNIYEKGNYRYGMRNSGVIVWKVDKSKITDDWLDSDWYVNSGGSKTSLTVLTDNANQPVEVANTLKKVGTKFSIPNVPLEFTVTDGGFSYKAKDGGSSEIGKQPEITAVNREIQVGSTFKPLEGVTATDGEGNDITSKIQVIENTVNVNKPGDYVVVYGVPHDGKMVTKSIRVTVVGKEVPAEKPKIEAPNLTLEVGSKFEPMQGVKATDASGVNITEKVEILENTVDVNKEGNYIVVYRVTDSGGNTSIKDRLVTVVAKGEQPSEPDKDTEPPVIVGAESKVIYVGDKFDPMKGVSATDNVDSMVTVRVAENTVNTKVAGTYSVVYEASDKAGNVSRVTRQVRVVDKDGNNETEQDKIAPVIKILGGANTLVTQPKHPIRIQNYLEALDDVDGDVGANLKINDSAVKWNEPGNYKVVAEASDKAGNKGKLEFGIKVIEDKPGLNYDENIIKVGDKFDALEGVKYVTIHEPFKAENIKVIDNNVDTAKEGTYQVKYEVTLEGGEKRTFVREVKVANEGAVMPEIKLPEYITVSTDSLDNLAKFAEAPKDVQINVSKPNVGELGKTLVKYEFVAPNGAKAVRYAVVNVVPPGYENGSPIINAKDKVITLGDKFDPKAGVTVIDAEDGDLTDKLVVKDNEVKTDTLGSYNVTYMVVDSDRNVSTTTISVKVVEKTGIDNTKPDAPNQKPGDSNNTGNAQKPNNGGGNNLLDGIPNGSQLNQTKPLDGKIPGTGTVASTGIWGAVVAFFGGATILWRKRK